MSLVVNTNVSYPTAQRSRAESTSVLDNTTGRLSLGSKISGQSDDVIGLAIVQRITSQINGLLMAVKNANEGISIAQSIEGGLGEVSGILQRLRDLAVQAANDTNTATDRAFLQAEVKLLIAEIARVSANTHYYDQRFMSSTFINKQIQVGTTLTPKDNYFTTGIASLINVSNIDLRTQTEASDAISALDGAVEKISSTRTDLDALENRLSHMVSDLINVTGNATADESRINDADYAIESANLAKAKVVQQGHAAILTQANARSQSVFQLLQ